jgi:hypothetical protein
MSRISRVDACRWVRRALLKRRSILDEHEQQQGQGQEEDDLASLEEVELRSFRSAILNKSGAAAGQEGSSSSRGSCPCWYCRSSSSTSCHRTRGSSRRTNLRYPN